MIFNSAAEVKGKIAVLAAIEKYWKSFGKLEHDLLNIYGTNSSSMLEAFNHCHRLDGKPVTLRAVALTDRDVNGLVKSFRLYTDTQELFKS